jgi:hypothetical protein
MVRRKVLAYPAISGTRLQVPGSTDYLWFSSRGWVQGSASGNVKALMEDRVLPGHMNSVGTALFREYNGIRQAIAVVDELTPHSLTV